MSLKIWPDNESILGPRNYQNNASERKMHKKTYRWNKTALSTTNRKGGMEHIMIYVISLQMNGANGESVILCISKKFAEKIQKPSRAQAQNFSLTP